MFSVPASPSVNVHFVPDVCRFHALTAVTDCSGQPSSVFGALILDLDVEVHGDDDVAAFMCLHPSPFACDVLLRPLSLRWSYGFKFEGIPLPKCKSDKSREVAFILLNELATGCASNLDLVSLALVRSFNLVVAPSLAHLPGLCTSCSSFVDADVFANLGVAWYFWFIPVLPTLWSACSLFFVPA